jgi:hypothetical protein
MKVLITLLLMIINKHGLACNYKILEQESEIIHSCIWNEDPLDEDFVKQSLCFLTTEDESVIKEEKIFFVLDRNEMIVKEEYVPIENYLYKIYGHPDFENLNTKKTFKDFFSINKKIYEDENTITIEKSSVLLLSTYVWKKVYDHFIMLRRQEKAFKIVNPIQITIKNVCSSSSKNLEIVDLNKFKKKREPKKEKKSRFITWKTNPVHNKPRT